MFTSSLLTAPHKEKESALIIFFGRKKTGCTLPASNLFIYLTAKDLDTIGVTSGTINEPGAMQLLRCFASPSLENDDLRVGVSYQVSVLKRWFIIKEFQHALSDMDRWV